MPLILKILPPFSAMMRRFHEVLQQGAKEVMVLGSRKPMREFCICMI